MRPIKITETKLITQNKHKKTKKLASWRQTSRLFTSVVEDWILYYREQMPLALRAGIKLGSSGLQPLRPNRSATLPSKINYITFYYFLACSLEPSFSNDSRLLVSLASVSCVFGFPFLRTSPLPEFAAFPSSSAFSPAVLEVFLKYAFFTSVRRCLGIFFSISGGFERLWAHTAPTYGSLSRNSNILSIWTKILSDFETMQSPGLSLSCCATVLCWS